MKFTPQFITNIQTVAKYESKVLVRSWFFRIFIIIAIIALSFFNVITLIIDEGQFASGVWIIKAVASNIPYMNLLLLNTGQAIIAIFLSSEFLKRDKQLDTSEVFYVRPLSNAEYVFGKIWGNLRVFFLLSIIVMGITMILNIAAENTEVDWMAYGIYFLLITVPTLIYIMGLATFLMLIIKNQALTFVILLGYIGITIFFIGDKFYYLFDYMAYNIPLFKSSIIGFSDLSIILVHRAIYLFLGLGFIFFTIFLFRRLPNSSRGHYPWVAVSFLFFCIGGLCGYEHINNTLRQDEKREIYIELNNKYVHTPKIVIDKYLLNVKQNPESISVVATITGRPTDTSKVFTFSLNPHLKVKSVTQLDKPLKYERKEHILLVDFIEELTPNDTLMFQIQYEGTIDESICYLDIPDEQLREPNSIGLVNIGKKYSFLTDDYLMVTPETYWYPRPGTAFSDISPDWQQTYFTDFTLEVEPLEGLTPISQGVITKDSIKGSYLFTPEYPAQTISLLIGNYKQMSIISDSVKYSIQYLEGHDYFSSSLESICDTIPSMINRVKEEAERKYNLTYPFARFSLVEVPGQFKGHERAWTGAMENIQPEMIFIPEKGIDGWQFDVISQQKRWRKYREHRGGKEYSDKEISIGVFNSFLWSFLRSEGMALKDGERGVKSLKAISSPYFIFPLLYNFRYNIFSTEWPIANRVIELYLLNNTSSPSWTRMYNGITNSEKASILMEKQSLKTLLGDVENRDIMDEFLSLRASKLFASSEINAGVTLFRDSLYSILDRNTFQNMQFERLLDSLETISNTDIHPYLDEWSKPSSLAKYTIKKPEVIQIRTRNYRGYVLSIEISNDSDHEGIIHMDTRISGPKGRVPDPRESRKIIFAPHETKRLVSHWENAPRSVHINTLISENLPSTIDEYIRNIKKPTRIKAEPEGDFTIDQFTTTEIKEIIVDNEDAHLFSISTTNFIGLLPRWLDKEEESSFKYAGLGWGEPLRWTLTTNAQYHGKYIRSAYVIKSGDGEQTATWRVPIKEEGRYDAYYHIYKGYSNRQQNSSKEVEYLFTIKYDDQLENAYIDVKTAKDGWVKLGTYDLKPDTIEVILSNKSLFRTVTADAVKFIRQQ